MNRYFISDKESDILITVATKVFGLKIGDIINMAIKNEFLPMTEPFRTEATFILQCRAENKLDAWKIKQSMTRGIRALGTRPVYDADRLQGFFARYHLHEDTENCTITENDALWESAVEVYELLGKQISTGGIQHFRGGKLHFVIQTADGLTFGEHDFGTTLFLDLFSHFFDAPCCKFGASVHRRKRKITCTLLGQTSVPHFPKIELKRAKFGKSGISVCLLENLEFLLAS